MTKWLPWFRLTRRKTLETLPLGLPGRLPWHCTVAEAKRRLRSLSALSPNVGGMPTARLRWGNEAFYARLDFLEGVVRENSWLAAHPGSIYRNGSGARVPIEPRLRAATVLFNERDPRKNWSKTLEVLGKPHERGDAGDWSWRWPEMTAQYRPAGSEEGAIESLRFEAQASCDVLEIRNQSSLELFERVRVSVKFRSGGWDMAETPAGNGVPVRVQWNVPSGESLQVTLSAEGQEFTQRDPAYTRSLVIVSDGRDGLRLVT